PRYARYRPQLTSTGSGTSSTPNRARTPSRTSRASMSRSDAVPSPRLLSASTCLPDRATRPPGPGPTATETTVFDQPRRRQLHGVTDGPARQVRLVRHIRDRHHRVGEERHDAPPGVGGRVEHPP